MFVKRPFSLILVATFVCGSVTAVAEGIALSLLHGQSRIDIPASAILRIEAQATISFINNETNEKARFPVAARRTLLHGRDPETDLSAHPTDHRTTDEHRRRL